MSVVLSEEHQTKLLTLYMSKSNQIYPYLNWLYLNYTFQSLAITYNLTKQEEAILVSLTQGNTTYVCIMEEMQITYDRFEELKASLITKMHKASWTEVDITVSETLIDVIQDVSSFIDRLHLPGMPTSQ